jgi:hypothetical protein
LYDYNSNQRYSCTNWAGDFKGCNNHISLILVSRILSKEPLWKRCAVENRKALRWPFVEIKLSTILWLPCVPSSGYRLEHSAVDADSRQSHPPPH